MTSPRTQMHCAASRGLIIFHKSPARSSLQPHVDAHNAPGLWPLQIYTRVCVLFSIPSIAHMWSNPSSYHFLFHFIREERVTERFQTTLNFMLNSKRVCRRVFWSEILYCASADNPFLMLWAGGEGAHAIICRLDALWAVTNKRIWYCEKQTVFKQQLDLRPVHACGDEPPGMI